MASSITDNVKSRRDREQVRAGVRARRFSGSETLQMGLDLSDFALRATKEIGLKK